MPSELIHVVVIVHELLRSVPAIVAQDLHGDGVSYAIYRQGTVRLHNIGVKSIDAWTGPASASLRC